MKKILKNVPNLNRQGNVEEDFLFCACMRASMQFLKEDPAYDFVHFASVSGSFFKIVWYESPKWVYCEDITGPHDFQQHDEAVIKSFASVGYTCELYHRNAVQSNQQLIMDKIKEAINAGYPVLSFGIVGPPCCSLITGYDDEQNALYGWSKFQDENNTDGFESCGYFKKCNGLTEIDQIVFFGEKIKKPSIKKSYENIIENLPEFLTTPSVRIGGKEAFFGISAYEKWAEALESDNDFVDDGKLPEQLDSHVSMLTQALVTSDYSIHFFNRAIEILPDKKDLILKIINCVEKEKQFFNEIIPLQEGFYFDQNKLMSNDFRKQLAKIIRKANEELKNILLLY